jgi:proteasome accessory factor B
MADPKAERLINLVMALLATRRYLSKAEIFESIPGYSGSPETMERMFERDKDDLRDLGIEIEVGSHDPLFEDEVGYRISPHEYELDLGELTAPQIAYLSLAANLWTNRLFSQEGSKALRKIQALTGESDISHLSTNLLNFENETPHIDLIWQAISEAKLLTFTYESSKVTKRTIAPYGLSLWHGTWYLVGQDMEKSEIRVFRVSRIASDLTLNGKGKIFVIPKEFSIRDHLVMLNHYEMVTVVIRARTNKAQRYRVKGTTENIDAEWDRIIFTTENSPVLISDLLWHGVDLIVDEPADLRARVLARILEKNNG